MNPARFDQDLIDQAAFERDRRERKLPARVANGEMSAEDANLDFQCWHCIEQWLREGQCKLIGGYGGSAEPPVNVLTWQRLEDAAHKALAALEAKISKAELSPGSADKPGALAVLRVRRESVWLIHRILVNQRESVERFERQDQEARARRAERAAAA